MRRPAATAWAWRYHNDSLGNRLLAQQQELAAEMGRTLRVSYADPASDRLATLPMDDAGRPWPKASVITDGMATALVSGLESDLIGLRSATYGNGVTGQWQRSREGVLARVAYTSPLLAKSALRTAFENLMPQAHAEAATSSTMIAESSSEQAPKQLPGAFGLEPAPRAFWDGRLLYDKAGNVQVQGQFAESAAARPAQTRYTYDGLDQLAQAVRIGAAEVDVRLTADREPTALSGTAWRYHTDSLGNRLLAQQQESVGEMGRTVRMSYADHASDRLGAAPMDVAGRPLAEGERHYAWDAEGRLAAVSQPGKPTSQYRYDARGLRVSKQIGADSSTHYLYDERRQRIAELDARGRIEREYVWLGSQLLAVIDLDAPRVAGAAPGDALGRFVQLVTTTWRQWTGHADTLTYVHTNHLGAPVALTDANARLEWSAEYAPYGQRLATKAPILATVGTSGEATPTGVAGIRLDLQLPGQWEDQETGLYYNDHRFYDPQAGRYLNPDPSGLSGGLNAYAYAGNNPLGFADPLGLVLFAFDGTGNTNDSDYLSANHSSFSNVWNFQQLYNDGNRRYITGVGTDFIDTTYGNISNPWYRGGAMGDAGLNWTGEARIDRMVQYFNDEADLLADDNTAMEVDIIGFSRGAAEARDFANSVLSRTSNGYYNYKAGDGKQHCQKVDFRFMGLFDTVLSTNSGGHAYNLAIPDAFAYVAQAAALNEYRGDTSHAGVSSFGAFPLESISQTMASPLPEAGKTRIERGFIGAHADIGGGFGANENQLSQVALFWMVTQAQAAGVQMADAPSSIIANPVIHDKSDNILTGAPRPDSEDRQVRYRDGTTTTQRNMPMGAGMTYADTTQFIHYFPPNDPRRKSQFQTGTVDTKGYLQWLGNNGYGIGLKVP